MGIPDHAPLPSHDSGEPLLPYFVEDGALPDTKYLMRLYPRRVVTDKSVFTTVGVSFLHVGKAVVLSEWLRHTFAF